MDYLGVDPSINGSAFALLIPSRVTIVVHKFAIKKDITFQEKLFTQAFDVGLFLNVLTGVPPSKRDSWHKNTLIAIEQPGYQSGEIGMASWETNKLTKLCAAFGVLAATLTNPNVPDNIFLPTVPKWKGNVPKYIMARRLQTKYADWECAKPFSDFSHDEFDALGLADWIYEQDKSSKPVSKREVT